MCRKSTKAVRSIRTRFWVFPRLSDRAASFLPGISRSEAARRDARWRGVTFSESRTPIRLQSAGGCAALFSFFDTFVTVVTGGEVWFPMADGSPFTQKKAWAAAHALRCFVLDATLIRSCSAGRFRSRCCHRARHRRRYRPDQGRRGTGNGHRRRFPSCR